MMRSVVASLRMALAPVAVGGSIAVIGALLAANPPAMLDGWREQGMLAVAVDDERLTWPERELVRQLGDRLYGRRMEAQHG